MPYEYEFDPEYYLKRFHWTQTAVLRDLNDAAIRVEGGEARINEARKTCSEFCAYVRKKRDILRLGAFHAIPIREQETLGGQTYEYRRLIVGPFEGQLMMMPDGVTIWGRLFLWHNRTIFE